MAQPAAVKKETPKAVATAAPEVAAALAAPAKAATVITPVTMKDGRTVNFAGKRKMSKEIEIKDGKVTVRFDFVNGESRRFEVPSTLMLQCAGHGASQKIGDEAAGVEDIDDIVVAVDDIITRLNKGEWATARAAGDGFSGASLVIRAIGEVTGKSVEDVKTFLQKKLDDAKTKGEELSRRDLYASFRNPASKTGIVIARLEKEKASKASKVNADDLLSELK